MKLRSSVLLPSSYRLWLHHSLDILWWRSTYTSFSYFEGFRSFGTFFIPPRPTPLFFFSQLTLFSVSQSLSCCGVCYRSFSLQQTYRNAVNNLLGSVSAEETWKATKMQYHCLKIGLRSICGTELIHQMFSVMISTIRQEILTELITGFRLASLFYFQIIFLRNTWLLFVVNYRDMLISNWM